jgi:hypothetical protein
MAEREIAEAEDRYQAHRVVELYRKMKKILEQDMNFDDVQETFFSQNMDNGKLDVELWAERELGAHGIADSGASTKLIFEIHYWAATPLRATDNGYFGLVELDVLTKLQVEMPGKDRFVDSLLRRVWFNSIYRRQFRYWIEYGEEETLRFINVVRNFLGFEPTVGKSRRLHFEPLEYSL